MWVYIKQMKKKYPVCPFYKPHGAKTISFFPGMHTYAKDLQYLVSMRPQTWKFIDIDLHFVLEFRSRSLLKVLSYKSYLILYKLNASVF